MGKYLMRAGVLMLVGAFATGFASIWVDGTLSSRLWETAALLCCGVLVTGFLGMFLEDVEE